MPAMGTFMGPFEFQGYYLKTIALDQPVFPGVGIT